VQKARDEQDYIPHVDHDKAQVLNADRELTESRLLHQPLVEAVAEADKAKQVATEQLQKAQADQHEVARKARAAFGKRQTPKLPTQGPAVAVPPPPPSPPKQSGEKTKKDKRKKPPSSPDATPAKKPKVKYVTKPKIQGEPHQWYQMIGSQAEAEKLYHSKNVAANKGGLPVGESDKECCQVL
jgi:hypothetical protein